MEITSRYDGVVKKLHYQVGEMAKVGSTLIDIEVDEATASAVEKKSAKSPGLRKAPVPAKTPVPAPEPVLEIVTPVIPVIPVQVPAGTTADANSAPSHFSDEKVRTLCVLKNLTLLIS